MHFYVNIKNVNLVKTKCDWLNQFPETGFVALVEGPDNWNNGKQIGNLQIEVQKNASENSSFT